MIKKTANLEFAIQAIFLQEEASWAGLSKKINSGLTCLFNPVCNNIRASTSPGHSASHNRLVYQKIFVQLWEKIMTDKSLFSCIWISQICFCLVFTLAWQRFWQRKTGSRGRLMSLIWMKFNEIWVVLETKKVWYFLLRYGWKSYTSKARSKCCSFYWPVLGIQKVCTLHLETNLSEDFAL